MIPCGNITTDRGELFSRGTETKLKRRLRLDQRWLYYIIFILWLWNIRALTKRNNVRQKLRGILEENILNLLSSAQKDPWLENWKKTRGAINYVNFFHRLIYNLFLRRRRDETDVNCKILENILHRDSPLIVWRNCLKYDFLAEALKFPRVFLRSRVRFVLIRFIVYRKRLF